MSGFLCGESVATICTNVLGNFAAKSGKPNLAAAKRQDGCLLSSHPCAMSGALMSSESRVMDKKDKSVVTSGLKITHHEDEAMKAMVGVPPLPESVHMLVLTDPSVIFATMG